MDTRTKIPPLDELPSYAEAKRRGLTWCNRGRPCKHGHVAPFNARHGYCRECLKHAQKRYEATDQGRQVQCEAQARYSASDKGRVFESAYMSDYYQRPEVKAVTSEYMRSYYQRPEVKVRWKVMDAERCAAELCATPAWLTDAHREQIKAIYDVAGRLTMATGIAHHVDHAVPLQGRCPQTRERNVCGLHIPLNLQVLTMQENLSKGCWFDDWGLAESTPGV